MFDFLKQYFCDHNFEFYKLYIPDDCLFFFKLYHEECTKYGIKGNAYRIIKKGEF